MGLKRPSFSIIIPTYERPRQLEACLQALTRLDYNRDYFEVIVVDDGGQAPLERVVALFQKQLDVTLLSQPNAGPAAARNTAATQAKGEVLAFTDDDCEPAVDWLQTLGLRFAKTTDCAIGGSTINALPENPYSAASQILLDYLYTYYNADRNQARFFASNNLAMPADRFLAVGGFTTTFLRAAAEDRELCDRWLLHGYRLIYAREVIVYHAHFLRLRTFFKQHLNYGSGAYNFHKLRMMRGQVRVRLEPLTFYLNLLRYPSLKSWSPRAALLTALLLVSQVANACGYLMARSKMNRSVEEFTPIVETKFKSIRHLTGCDDVKG
jgi:GT2 family glycosyltransferase